MKQSKKFFISNIIVALLVFILTTTFLFYYPFKNKQENLVTPIKYEMPEDVILQYNDTYVDCKQVSEYEIYCIVKDTKEV